MGALWGLSFQGPKIAFAGAERTLFKPWKSGSSFYMMSSEAIEAQHSVTGFNARSNEVLCCVYLRISLNRKRANYFPRKLPCQFPYYISNYWKSNCLKLRGRFTGNVIRNHFVGTVFPEGRAEGGVTPPSLFHHRCRLFTPPQFSHIYFSSLPLHSSNITWLFSNDVTLGRRRIAIWRPGWQRRLRWQCVGLWRRDGKGLYYRLQVRGPHCGGSWQAGCCIHHATRIHQLLEISPEFRA